MFVCFVDWVCEWFIQRLNRPLPVKPLLRIAIGAALFAGWYALMTVPPSRLLDATPRGRVDFTISESSPAYSIATALEEGRWRLVQCEAKPTACADAIGYRVTLAYDWMDAETDSDRFEPKTHSVYGQFLFVPEDQTNADRLAPQIPWQDLEYAPPRWFVHQDPLRIVDMGSVHGFRVYGFASIALQENARARLGTVGGDDRLALLEALLDQSYNDLAYLKTIRMVARHGASGVPILEREIGRSEGIRKYALIKSLADVPGVESATALQALYRDPESQHLVVNALGDVPPRDDIVDLYMDLVRKNSSSTLLARAYATFVQLEPDKAEMAFARMREAPRTILQFAAATRGLRAVRGEPFSPDLERAGNTMRVAGCFLVSHIRIDVDTQQARNLLTGTDDIEAALTIALEVALSDHNAGVPLDRSLGMDILLALPETRVVPQLALLGSLVTDDGSRAFAGEMLNHCSLHVPQDSNTVRIASASS